MANIAISQLPPAVTLDGAELVPIDQPDGLGGYSTVVTTIGKIANAPVAAPFVIAEASPVVPQARVLEGTAGNISVTDQGAGSGIVLDLVDTAATPGTYGDQTHVVRITVDQKGRITAIANVDVALLITQYLQSLPTTLPSQPNQPWNNGGLVSIS
jgi:hypothetical protein